MTEINDFDRHTLFAQGYRHWRENERRRRVTGEICFLQFWPAIKTKRLKKAVACYLFVNEIGNRTGEMTCDRQKSDSKFLFIAGRGVF